MPPSYFDNLVAALKSTPPLPMGDSAYSFPTLLSSLKLDSEKPLSPITLRTGQLCEHLSQLKTCVNLFRVSKHNLASHMNFPSKKLCMVT